MHLIPARPDPSQPPAVGRRADRRLRRRARTGDRSRVVDDVSFTIGRGERFALVGESGSGKTVTAQAIMRLHDNADYGGSVRFEGRDLLTASDREMRAHPRQARSR